MKKLAGFALIASTLATTACTTMVANDYPQYLTNNTGQVQAQRLNTVAKYTISDKLMAHQFSVRSFAAGIANSWVVEAGKMLQTTLASADYSSQFSAGNDQGLELAFDLENYEFRNFQTYLTLKVTATKNGQQVLSKSYTSVGANQTSKVMLGGGFAMKNAIQQSTKLAMDDVLKQLIGDLKAQNIAIVSFQPKQA